MTPSEIRTLYTTWGYAHYELFLSRLPEDKLTNLRNSANEAEKILTDNGYPMPIKPGTMVDLPYGYNPCIVQQIVEYCNGKFRYLCKDRRQQTHIAKEIQITISQL